MQVTGGHIIPNRISKNVFLCVLCRDVSSALADPLRDFFARYRTGGGLILALICLYRIPDFVLNIMNPFYLDLGYSLVEIAEVRNLKPPKADANMPGASGVPTRKLAPFTKPRPVEGSRLMGSVVPL